MKKLKNKGFSMVEIIVVVAIMAIVASAATLGIVKYIAKTRESTDLQTCSTIKTCVNSALATETIWDELAGWSRQKFAFYIRVTEDENIIIDGLRSGEESTKVLKESIKGLSNPKVAGKNSYMVTVDVVASGDEEDDAVDADITYAIGDIQVDTSNHTFESDSDTPIYVD